MINLHHFYAVYLQHARPKTTCITTGRQRAVFRYFYQHRLCILQFSDQLQNFGVTVRR